VLVVGIGALVPLALEVGAELAANGARATVVDPRWVLPVEPALLKLVAEHAVTVTLEDGIVDGGIGALVAQRAVEQGLRPSVHAVGVPLRFIRHSSRAEILDDLGLEARVVTRDVLAMLARQEAGLD
jgi:1-deoxy-D-xylulose-5-phosphate synthase